MRKMVKSKGFKIAAVVVFLASLYAGKILATNNFHTVVPGEVYRSAQVDEEEIAYYKNNYHIKSIINLRGEEPGSEWYDDEIAQSSKMGITHLNFPMRTSRELTQAQINELIEKMRTAPKPLLIHCENGANRTGLAAALYMAAIKKQDADTADDQLSIKYGHVNLGIFASKAMGESFEKFEKWR